MSPLSRLRGLSRATKPAQSAQSAQPAIPEHYTLLGLPYISSCVEVKSRFLELQELVSALPDVFNAFHVLSDKERKAEYDRTFFLSGRVRSDAQFVSVKETAAKMLRMGAGPASCPKVGKHVGDRSSFYFDSSEAAPTRSRRGSMGGKFVEDTSSFFVDASEVLV